MKVEMMGRSDADDVLRIVVRLERWTANVEVLAVVRHDWNHKLVVTDLARTSLYSQTLEPTADATLLIFKPSPPSGASTPFFGFNAQGHDVQLGRLSCRATANPPPSPPPFVFNKAHKNKHAPAGVATSAGKGPDQDQPLGFAALLILAAAFLFMFKDLVARVPGLVVARVKRALRLPTYGTVVTVDADAMSELQSASGVSEAKCQDQQCTGRSPKSKGSEAKPGALGVARRV